MRFLIDASLPRSTAALIVRCCHEAIDVRDIGPSIARDSDIASYAQTHGFTLLSADFDFADIREYPPANYPGIVVIDRPDGSSIAQVLELVELLLNSSSILTALPGRLAIVDPRRIRLRPAVPEPGI